MVLQKADPQTLADIHCNDGADYRRLFVVSNRDIIMKAKVIWFFIGVIIASFLSPFLYYPIIFERGYKQGVRDAYNAKNGLQISEAYLPNQIAGAGDDGVRRIYAKD